MSAGGDWIDQLTPNEIERLSLLIHRAADTDRDRTSIHHTLGVGPTQAAYGDHAHDFSTTAGAIDMAPFKYAGGGGGSGAWLQILGGLTPPSGVTQEWWILPAIKAFFGTFSFTYNGTSTATPANGNISDTLTGLAFIPFAVDNTREGWDPVGDVALTHYKAGQDYGGYIDHTAGDVIVTNAVASQGLIAGANVSFGCFGFFTNYVGSNATYTPPGSTGTARGIGRRR